jgi:hypothetical protein
LGRTSRWSSGRHHYISSLTQWAKAAKAAKVAKAAKEKIGHASDASDASDVDSAHVTVQASCIV